MKFFENMGKHIGKVLKEVIEAPIDLTKGILEGAELIDKNKEDEKDEEKVQSNSCE